MNGKEIYTNSILTFAFTNDGKMIVRRDKKGKIDTLPWLFMGYHERGSKVDYENGVWVMNNADEYKEKIATFFAYHLRNSRNALLNGFFIGNGNHLLDVGELHEKIMSYQIDEMRTIHTPSYIRVNRKLYEGGTTQNGQRIINRIETRYVVLPNDEDIEDFPELEAKELNDVRRDSSLLSDKMILGITGENGEIMESFISQLTSLNKGAYFKKIDLK